MVIAIAAYASHVRNTYSRRYDLGGGGGGDSGSLGDTSYLEGRAREILRQGETGKKNVFISFAYEDVAEVNLLRGQAKNDNSPIEFNDHSLNEPFDSERAEYIKQRLRERINRCSTTVVYLSSSTRASPWVQWEVEKSIELGKRVLATFSGTAPPSKLPSFVKEQDIKVIPWSNLADELNRD